MRVVSLFSGAGGLDLGLVQAGLDIVWANDIFLDAAATYKHNIGDHISTEDICDIKSSDIPDCDVVVGGFPCQGFSVANWARTAGDPRNQLYRQLLRVVKDKQPKYFVGENVRGLASMSGGLILRNIVKDFEKIGYRVKYAVVNSADYGVPQKRFRLIIVGVRAENVELVEFPPKATHVDPAKAGTSNLPEWFSVGRALSHFTEPDVPNDHLNHECSRYKLRFNGHLGHRRIDPDKPAPTVTARGDDKGGVVVLHHPGNLRRMTARELAAVQSFPDDFFFVGTKTSAYRQIANAVPPLLGRAIGRMLMETEQQATIQRGVAA